MTVVDITIRFSDVTQLRLPELGSLFYLSESEVEDVSRDQLEGIRYRVRDVGNSEFELLCRGIALTLENRTSRP